MLKNSENNTSNKRELSNAKDSVREKLRAKIREKLHNLPSEAADENVNTLNQQKSTRRRQGRGKPTTVQDNRVRPCLSS